MREPSSEGIFRTGTLGYIRFFWPFNHIGLKNLVVEIVLALFVVSPHLDSLQLAPESLLDLLVFLAYLFAGVIGEIVIDDSEVCSVLFDELDKMGMYCIKFELILVSPMCVDDVGCRLC